MRGNANIPQMIGKIGRFLALQKEADNTPEVLHILEVNKLVFTVDIGFRSDNTKAELLSLPGAVDDVAEVARPHLHIFTL